MHHPLIPLSPIRHAILYRRFPDDIARQVMDNLRIFHVDPTLYDTPGLQGPAKHAELVVKLGYWLAVGRLTADEFRDWVVRIPPEDNRDWEVDLFSRRPGSVLPRILKMGPLVARPEPVLAREA